MVKSKSKGGGEAIERTAVSKRNSTSQMLPLTFPQICFEREIQQRLKWKRTMIINRREAG